MNSGNNPNIFTIEGTYSTGLNSGTPIDCMLGSVTSDWNFIIYASGASNDTPTYNTGATSVLMPSACYNVRSTYINEFLDEIGYYSSLQSTYTTHDAELQGVVSSGFQNEVNAVNNVNNTLQDVNSSVEDVNQSVMDMIDTIVAPYVNVTQDQLPQSNVQDSTEDGLNNIFLIIKNAFTGQPQSVDFPIPFTNEVVTLEPGFTENAMNKGGLGAMVTVIHLYWYYRIYSYIFLRYVELLEKLKEGEFEETVGNIKKEVM